MARILGTIASSLFEAVGDFESIASYSLSSSESSVTFSSIPNTYTHLQMRVLLRNSRETNVHATPLLRPNGDTAHANYAYHHLTSDGSSITAGNLTSGNYNGVLTGSFPAVGGYSGVYGYGVWNIFDYANTNKFKTFSGLSAYDSNNNGMVVFHSNVWMSTSAISSLQLLFVDNYSMVSGSHIALYGIKG